MSTPRPSLRYNRGMKTFAKLEDLRALTGEPLGTSDWIEVSQARIQQFADATDDHQWIHLDVERARTGPFKTPIAHGFLTLSLLPQFLATSFKIADVIMGVNYGLNRVRFPTPVPAGSRVRAHVKLIKFEPLEGGAQLTTEITVELEGAPKPACVAESVSRSYTQR
jgi:acyl dehydratase